MIATEVIVTNRNGLHARPAARFVALASEFEASVRLACGTQVVNGKSILGVLILAAARGARLQIIVDGRDEKRALQKLAALVQSDFAAPGETPCH